MKPLDRIGERERHVVGQRRDPSRAPGELTQLGGDLEPTLRALLERLLPGVPATIDLASFVDEHAAEPLGRGDRAAGLPPTPELFSLGLTALAAEGFVEMDEADQRDVISRMRHGEAYGSIGRHAKEFVNRLLDKALAGYLAHPDTWQRIGFNGPAYPQGYAWIGIAEAAARHDKKPGWDKL